MSYRFKPGDSIRVSRIAGSTWQDRHGTVVDVIVRYDNEPVQECAVSIEGHRRWFMARHLIRTVGPKLLRFFRNEAMDRWNLDPDQSALLNGDLDQLVDLLCEHRDFTIPRAQAAVEELYNEVDRKTRQTPEVEAPAVGVYKMPAVRRADGAFAETQTAA